METVEFTTREIQIIEAAKQVFIRNGYEETTMSDVAREAGMGRTALHYYFRTKEILFDAIIGQLLSGFLPNVSKVLEKGGNMIEKMPEIISLYMEVVLRNKMFPLFLIKEINRDPQYIFAAIRRDSQRIKPIMALVAELEKEMQEGIIRKMPVVDLLTTIASLVVFPILIREPMTELVLDNDSSQFDEYIARRREIVIEMVTNLMKP